MINGDDRRRRLMDEDYRWQQDESDMDLLNFESSLSGSLVEIVFVVKRPVSSDQQVDEASENSIGRCLNGKVISKILSKRKTVIQKRMKPGPSDQSINFKIVDMSFTRECLTKRRQATTTPMTTDDTGDFFESLANFEQVVMQYSICTTNLALKNCKLKIVVSSQRTAQLC